MCYCHYRKKPKSYNFDEHDNENYFHVTMETGPSIVNGEEEMNFTPLTYDRRSNSTSQILQMYTFDEEELVSPV